jgi:hypothetical protein
MTTDADEILALVRRQNAQADYMRARLEAADRLARDVEAMLKSRSLGYPVAPEIAHLESIAVSVAAYREAGK